MSQVLRDTGPAIDEAIAAGVPETLATPSISVVDRVGPLLIIGSIEVDVDAAVSSLLTADLVVNGAPLGLSFGRQTTNPIVNESCSVTFVHVIAAPAVGDTIQLQVTSSGAANQIAGFASLVVVALPASAAEVAGLVSP